MIKPAVFVALLALSSAGCIRPLKPVVLSPADARAASAIDGIRLTGRVVDAAGVLPPVIVGAISTRSSALEERTGHQLIVVTIKTLDGADIDRASLRLFTRWGVGRKNANDGVGILIAPNEHRVLIEVSRGLESQLTNAESARIIAEQGLPDFRLGKISAGPAEMANAVVLDLERSPATLLR